MRHVIGIDPGQKGAWCCLEVRSGDIEEWSPLPIVAKELDGALLSDVLTGYWPEEKPMVAIEKIHGVPKWGASNFAFGANFGIIKGVCMALKLSRFMIPPKEWQKEMLKGKPRGEKTKASALQTAREIWPSEPWLATTRCSKPHDGAVDAALIAEYCRRKYCGLLS